MRARASSQCAVSPYLHYSILAAAGATTPSLTTAKVGRRDSVRTDEGKPRRSESGHDPHPQLSTTDAGWETRWPRPDATRSD